MRAVTLSIGSELVTGLVADTHGRRLGRALGTVGAVVLRHEMLDDDAEAIAAAFARAARDADLVVATGGLGPTPDDLTRDGLAQALGTALAESPEAMCLLRAWAEARGRTLSESNRRQALLPQGAEALPNPVGSAPGILARLGRATVFCLPGVPSEMERMLADQVLPRLRAGAEARVLRVRTVRTFGLPESVIGERLADLMAPGRRPRIATAASAGVIDIHIHADGPEGEADAILASGAAEVRRRLGDAVFAEGTTTLEESVAALLARRGLTVAVAESCTGGLVAARLVNVPGMSNHLLEGVVAYSNRAKERLLGVPADRIERHGAVSEAVARAMAEGARAGAGADLGLAVTGIAGPGGGSSEKPVGTVWFALADAAGADAVRELFPGDRQTVRERAVLYALNLVRLRLESTRKAARRNG